MEKSKVLREHAIFPKGEKIANDHFIGTAWLRVLVPDDSTFHCPVFNVIFEPGARNNWHEHPGRPDPAYHGRGKGYYQEEGRKIRKLRPGDVVKIQPEVKHWHGAASDSLVYPYRDQYQSTKRRT